MIEPISVLWGEGGVGATTRVELWHKQEATTSFQSALDKVCRVSGASASGQREAPSTRSPLTGRRLRQGRPPPPSSSPAHPPASLYTVQTEERVRQCIIDTTKGRRLIDQSVRLTAGMYVQDGDGCCCCFLRLQNMPPPPPSDPAGEESDTCAALLGSAVEKRSKVSLQ